MLIKTLQKLVFDGHAHVYYAIQALKFIKNQQQILFILDSNEGFFSSIINKSKNRLKCYFMGTSV